MLESIMLFFIEIKKGVYDVWKYYLYVFIYSFSLCRKTKPPTPKKLHELIGMVKNSFQEVEKRLPHLSGLSKTFHPLR